MDDTPFVPVGRIVKPHGLNGELSIMLGGTGSIDIPVGLAVWIVPPISGPCEFLVTSVRPGPKGPLVQLDTITNRAEAEPVRGRTLMARAADLPAQWVAEGRHDIGMIVVDVSRGVLGEIVDVIETGANDVWVVDGAAWGEVLIPVIDDVVLELDQAAKRVTVKLLPGLIDDEGTRP